jgi:hypothetical protein
MSGAYWQLYPAPQYGRRRLVGSGGGGTGGSYLPLSGGTMEGDINMAGYKIINLGQDNLQGRDAINFNTLTAASTTIEIASDGIFGNSSIFPSIETKPKPQSFTEIPNNFVVPVVPGLMTEFGIADTNWALVPAPNLPSYVLTANNVPGKFSAVKFSVQFQLEFQSALITSLPLYLVVFNIDNASVVASKALNVPRNSVTTKDISVNLAVSGQTMSKLCCTLIAGVDSITNDLTVTRAQLLTFCYLFTS